MYDRGDFPVPVAFSRDDWTLPPHASGVINARKTGKACLEGMNPVACSAREVKEAQALTCGMITMIDDAFGRVRDALIGSGRPSLRPLRSLRQIMEITLAIMEYALRPSGKRTTLEVLSWKGPRLIPRGDAWARLDGPAGT